MALFNKVQGVTGGDGFTSGPAPKGIMISPGVTVVGKDMYDNTFTLAVPTAGNGGHTKIFPCRLKEVTSCNGATAYMLF
jgi:hypothetical protein